jgi:hypothetical protein
MIYKKFTNKKIRIIYEGFLQQHIYEMAGLVLNRNFVHQRNLSTKQKHWFSKAATS